MENASKALLMAAGVLIGVVILSLAAYLFITFSSSADQMKERMADNQLRQFNDQFLSYEGKEELTIYTILTVVNLAENNNSNYELSMGDTNYITVKKGNMTVNSETITTIIKNNLDSEMTNDNFGRKKLKNYTCKVSLSNLTGRVNLVVFNPI